MMHCSECDATLNRFDSSCWNCSTTLGSRNAKGPKWFCIAVDLFFRLFLVMTVMSLFTDIAPAFKLCASALCIVRLVKSSADEMAKLRPLGAFRVVLKEQKNKLRAAAAPQWQLALEKSRRA